MPGPKWSQQMRIELPKGLTRRRRARLARQMSRRGFLQAAGGALAASSLPIFPTGCSLSDTEQPPRFLDGPARLPTSPWMVGAAVGGVELFVEMNGGELEAALDRVASQGLTVAELDSDLSQYLDDDAFAAQLEILDAAARGCHRRGIHAVAYYPALESLTNDAHIASTRTMSREHPDWLQIDLFNKPSVFIGGDGRVFWVDENTESAWLCPLTDYSDYYLSRVKLLAGTALDGVWPDVPLLSDIAATWPCTDVACRTRFHADTGYSIPTFTEEHGFSDHAGDAIPESDEWPNFDDPAFRRWVHWRHDIVTEFERKILSAAREVREDFEVIIETVTMDYSGATIQGLDGAWAAPDGLHRVWEVDAVSDDTGMRHADARDWLSMAVMMKHGRGCMGDAPSWAFCYGKEPDDAERVMGLAVATHNAPFEARIPDMITTVGTTYRQRIFGYTKQITDYYSGTSIARIAVLYHPTSRDLLDQTRGVGLYSGLDADDELWWTDAATDLAVDLPYLADYRGWCGALMAQHELFDVLIEGHASAEVLGRYDVVVLPSATSMSDDLLDRLHAWVDGGGTLLVTGSSPGLYDEMGVQRGSAAVADRFGIAASEAWAEVTFGKGRTIATTTRPGADWYRAYPSASALTESFGAIIAPYRTRPLTINAPSTVVVDARLCADGSTWVALGNLTGLGTGTPERFAPAAAIVE
ncbi:MAG: hypothetical protein ACI9OJ_001356, partial [Myxococcota bacterium]